MHRIMFLLFTLAVFAAGSHKIYLIHGFGSLPLSMVRIENELSKRGYSITNYGYNSLYTDLDSIGKSLWSRIASSGDDSVSFITHSMGALVVRSMCTYIDTGSNFPIIFRLIMLAPPNRGAEIADFFSSSAILNTLLGPNLQKMRTDSGSYAAKLPLPPCREVGVVIGIKRKGFWFKRMDGAPTDGYLTPKRAILGIEKDIAIVDESHALITMKRKVIDRIVHFLEEGSFSID